MDGWFDIASHLGWGLSWWSVLAFATYMTYGLAIASIPSVLLQRRGHPQSAIAWLLILFSLPLVGLFLWWVLGRKHLTRKRRKRLQATETVSGALSRLRETLPSRPEASWESLSLRRLPPEEAQWVFPPTSGNRVRLLRDAAQTYPAIEAAIDSATNHLHLLFYIWNDDATGRRFRDQLVEKAKSGVEVRVLCDAVGSPAARGRLMQPLIEAGGKVGIFLPPRLFSRNPHWNFRNHRKLVIADGCRGIVGGLNIGDEYTHQWHDTALEMRGAVVDQLQEVFADDWYFTTGENLSTMRYFGCNLTDQDEQSSWGSDNDAMCGVAHPAQLDARRAVHRHHPSNTARVDYHTLFDPQSKHSLGITYGRLSGCRRKDPFARVRRFKGRALGVEVVLSGATESRRANL